MNIPIYRAKRIDSDEWVEGYYVNGYIIITDSTIFQAIDLNCHVVKNRNIYKIDQNTLAIHFPNMVDKNGKKIFASLSEDGVGGDMLRTSYEEEGLFVYCEKTSSFVLRLKYDDVYMEDTDEVIGIHKG